MLETATCALIKKNLFVELMEKTTKTNVFALVKEIVRNTLKVLVLLKNLVPDVLVFWSQSAVERELLMTICVIYSVLKTNLLLKVLAEDTKTKQVQSTTVN